MEQFHYLLNAFEQASQADMPADAGYAEKRAALIKHLTELNIDAQRYRWLRKQEIIAVTSHDQSVTYQDSDLDAAIDAAMNGANSVLSRAARNPDLPTP